MTTPYDTIKSAVLGIPTDPNKMPSRTGVVKAFGEMQTWINGAQSGAYVRETKLALDALVAAPVSAMGWVMSGVGAGIYENTGTATAAVWTRRGDIPQFMITAMNVGEGTADAIRTTTNLPIPQEDGRALITAGPILVANTLVNPSIRFNDGSPYTIVTSSGGPLAPGSLTINSYVVGYISDNGTKFRLISEQASAAILAQAEAAAAEAVIAQVAAEAAQAAAEAAAIEAQADYVAVSTRAALKALDTTEHLLVYLKEIGIEGQFAWRTGNYADEVAADFDGYQYVPSDADPDGSAGCWVRCDFTKPENLFLGAFFHHQDDATIYLYVSQDGKSFKRLNSFPLSRNVDAQNVGSRDPSITYDNGEWLIAVTNASVGVYDFTIWRSADLMTWKYKRATLGPTPLSSATVPASGGAAPCDAIWAPEWIRIDGQLAVLISVRYEADFINSFGNNQESFKPFLSRCTDRSTLSFGPIERLVISDVHPLRVFQWTNGVKSFPTVPLKHQNYIKTYMGLDITFSQDFVADFALDDLIIIPTGKGGSGFSNSEWTAGGDAYVEALARINATIAAHPNAVVEAVIWQQGEADRNNATYQTQLVDLFSRLRTAVPKLVGVPILMGEMGTFVTPGTTDINAAIAAAAATIPNAHVVSSAGLTDKGDSLHFDVASNRTLGHRYYTEFEAARGSVGSDATAKERIVIIAGQSNAIGYAPFESTANIASMIDPDVIKVGNAYWMAIKNSEARNIRIYYAYDIQGPWTGNQVLSATDSLEAPCWEVIDSYNGGTPVKKYRIYVDNNRTSTDQLKGIYKYFEADSPGGTYGALQTCDMSYAVRHGTIMNLRDIHDPRAWKSLHNATIAFTGDDRTRFDYTVELTGDTTLYAKQDVLYYADGATGSVGITIGATDATRFFLGVFGTDITTGIVVGSGTYSGAKHTIGFGRSVDTIIEYRLHTDGKFYPVGHIGTGFAFSANKDGANQTITSGVETKITFATQEFDIGGMWDGANNQITAPVAGIIAVSATILINTATENDTNLILNIKKNNVTVGNGRREGSAGENITMYANKLIYVNAGDIIDFHILLNGTTDKAINGTSTNTYVDGHYL